MGIQSPPDFLRLPLELRFMVYSYLLPTVLNPPSRESLLPADETPYALRMTCHQIKDELDPEIKKDVAAYIQAKIHPNVDTSAPPMEIEDWDRPSLRAATHLPDVFLFERLSMQEIRECHIGFAEDLPLNVGIRRFQILMMGPLAGASLPPLQPVVPPTFTRHLHIGVPLSLLTTLFTARGLLDHYINVAPHIDLTRWVQNLIPHFLHISFNVYRDALCAPHLDEEELGNLLECLQAARNHLSVRIHPSRYRHPGTLSDRGPTIYEDSRLLSITLNWTGVLRPDQWIPFMDLFYDKCRILKKDTTEPPCHTALWQKENSIGARVTRRFSKAPNVEVPTLFIHGLV